MNQPRPETKDPPQAVSYSQLEKWLTCQLAWWFTYTTTATRSPSWAMYGGTTVHQLTHEWELEHFGKRGEVDEIPY